VKRSVLLAMIASSFASLSSGGLTARTLGALLAGSAMALSATAMHGGPLLAGKAKPASITERPARSTVAPPQQLPAQGLPAPESAPWTPDVASQFPPPFAPPFPLPPPTPLLFNPPYMAPFAPPPSTAFPATENAPGDPAAPTAPRRPGDTANPRPAGSRPGPADAQRGEPVDGVLGSVFGATQDLPR
jgi:hypothetical protein